MSRIITREDIERDAFEGRYELLPGKLLSPMARDYAESKGIAIVEPGQAAPLAPAGPSDEQLRDVTAGVARRLGHLEPAAIRLIAEEVAQALLHGAPADTAPSVSPEREAAARVRDEVLRQMTLRSDEERAEQERVIVTAAGQDQVGIAARFATAVAECQGNIHQISQTIVGEYFTMILVVDIQAFIHAGGTFEGFRRVLERVAADAGVGALVMHDRILSAMHRI